MAFFKSVQSIREIEPWSTPLDASMPRTHGRIHLLRSEAGTGNLAAPGWISPCLPPGISSILSSMDSAREYPALRAALDGLAAPAF